MGEMIPFISVHKCLEAITFYEEVFGAKQQGEMTMLSDISGNDSEEYQGLVGHCTLKVGSSRIFINDIVDDQLITNGNQIQLVLDLDSEQQLRRSFEMLRKNGKVVTKLQEVFWGALFGTVKDQFGVTWQIYYGHK